MLLLPDIQVHGNILSIEEPFTLNGFLVTDIQRNSQLSYDANPHNRIIIRNEEGYNLKLNSDELEYYFRTEMERFIGEHGRYAEVEGRRNNICWDEYTFTDYMRDIFRQTDSIRNDYLYSYGTYINRLKDILGRQRREYREPARIHYTTCNRPTIDSTHISTASLDTTSVSFVNGNSLSIGYSPATIYVDESHNFLRNTTINSDYMGVWNTRETTLNKYIHNYNYKPKYIHHYMPNEDKDITLLLGSEIEVDCGGKSTEHAKNVLEIMCGKDSEDKMFCVSDGSLVDGLEFVTMPCSLEYHKNEMKYKEMFEYLDKHGYKAHDTSTCGLHIHADRKYLGKTELVQQLTISKILYILEKFNEEICVIARRNNRYSQFVGAGKNETSVVELYNKYKDKDKYVALNLKHEASIEFRIFKSTLKYETYIITLEFVKKIIDYAKSINIENIETIKWVDLMDTFSDELKAYYNERLEKENKKKDTNTTSVLNETSTFTINDHSIATGRIASRNINRNYTLYNEPTSPNSFRNYMLTRANSVIDDCSCVVSVDLNNQQTEQNTIDILKSKEKQLKKQIKHSNNFMEKKDLKKALQETQKELKKEKKRLKREQVSANEN